MNVYENIKKESDFSTEWDKLSGADQTAVDYFISNYKNKAEDEDDLLSYIRRSCHSIGGANEEQDPYDYSEPNEQTVTEFIMNYCKGDLYKDNMDVNNMNVYESIKRNINESTGLNLLDYLNGKKALKETLIQSDISDEESDNIIERIAKELDSKLDRQDAVTLKQVGGWFIKDLNISKPSYGTSDVVNSSFTEHVDYNISCVATVDDKEIPITFDYKYVYNSYVGGWN